MPEKNTRRRGFKELILFILIITFIYFILAFFGSSISGADGQLLGKTLRETWGGALLVIFLFGIYVCVAKLMHLRIPKLPRQILGTLQLYISLTVFLGFLHESGLESKLAVFQPGIGEGIARFFILNVGTLATLILIACSFLFSAYLFGSKLFKLSLPDFSREHENNFDGQQKSDSRPRKRKTDNKIEEPFMFKKPAKVSKPVKNNNAPKFYVPDFPDPDFGDEPEEPEPQNDEDDYEQPAVIEPELELESTKDPLNIIDRIISSIDAGEFNAPEKKAEPKITRQKRIRRPLPDLRMPLDDESKTGDEDNKTWLTNDPDDETFPPPADIFGEDDFDFELKNDLRQSEKQGKIITATLKNFGVNSSVANIIHAPQVIQFQIEPAQGTKVNKIIALADDLAMNLGVMPVRVEAPIPATHYAGVEIPNPNRKFISFRNIFDSQEFKNANIKLPVPLGLNMSAKIIIKDLDNMPVILLAGNSGSGLGNFLGVCILSLTSRRKPNELKLLMIDPEHIELALYEGLPHLISRTLTAREEIIRALNYAVNETETRAGKLAAARVRNVDAYNRKLAGQDHMPYIVIVMNAPEEILMTSDNKIILNMLAKISRKSKMCGVCLIIATRRPSQDILGDSFKSEISGRIAFTLSSAADSRLVLDYAGAEKLTGKGDMLFRGSDLAYPVRFQTPYLSEERISDFIDYMAGRFGNPELREF